MKKTNFLYASLMMAACTFGVQSCTVDDNPAPDPTILTEVFTYDFEAAFNASENPGNKNGSAANGQAFYGWESAENTDKLRQDYKGYEWAEGSVLPEVCHVWRRSDRINGNIKDGGLYCPSDKEMAIDGLSTGSIVQITYDPGMKEEQVDTIINLQDVPFYDCEGTFGKEAKKENTTNYAWVVNSSTGQPYGDGNVNNFADLSAYEKLIVVATDGQPRFCFNRDQAEGQQDANDEENSHLIDYPNKGGWSARYFTSEAGANEGETVWIVDLAQMVKDKGYAHLHAIKGANWANCTVTSMTLIGKTTVLTPLDSKLLWAIGSSEELGARAEAQIEGVDEVVIPGQTEIASDAKILVKSVTPADKGTGYIVVKVKKGMTIKKVVITNFTEQMPY